MSNFNVMTESTLAPDPIHIPLTAIGKVHKQRWYEALNGAVSIDDIKPMEENKNEN